MPSSPFCEHFCWGAEEGVVGYRDRQGLQEQGDRKPGGHRTPAQPSRRWVGNHFCSSAPPEASSIPRGEERAERDARTSLSSGLVSGSRWMAACPRRGTAGPPALLLPTTARQEEGGERGINKRQKLMFSFAKVLLKNRRKR